MQIHDVERRTQSLSFRASTSGVERGKAQSGNLLFLLANAC
jgi:hypothetical protein